MIDIFLEGNNLLIVVQKIVNRTLQISEERHHFSRIGTWIDETLGYSVVFQKFNVVRKTKEFRNAVPLFHFINQSPRYLFHRFHTDLRI